MGALSKFQAFLFASLLAKKFTDWDAYKLGLIDKKGKLIKKASSAEEKKALGTFENLVRKVKSVILKFVPDNKYLQFIISAYLLKENENEKHKEIIYNELNEEEKIQLDDIINNCINLNLGD